MSTKPPSLFRLVWLLAFNRAWRMALTERVRQVEREGWTADHDDDHARGELAAAAACYAIPPAIRGETIGRGNLTLPRHLWPWGSAWWKPVPDDRARELVKAIALLLAELERELRMRARAKKGGRI